MGDYKQYQAMTTWDRLSVVLYRLGIVLAAMSLIYGGIIFWNYLSGNEVAALIDNNLPQIMFWVFTISVGISLVFLHLYDKRILMIFRAFWIIGLFITLLVMVFKIDPPYFPAIFKDTLGVIGVGFLAGGFSGIGAKEAFCFKLYEGYLYALLFVVLTLVLLPGVFPNWLPIGIYLLITLIVTIFTIRKLMLPGHVDIGDKSRY